MTLVAALNFSQTSSQHRDTRNGGPAPVEQRVTLNGGPVPVEQRDTLNGGHVPVEQRETLNGGLHQWNRGIHLMVGLYQ